MIAGRKLTRSVVALWCLFTALFIVTANRTGEATAVDSLVITVVYDNVTTREDLRPSWGFSCLIQGLEKIILFDTGADGPTLLSNMQALNLSPATIDAVVLSHLHGDHTGGLGDLLKVNSAVTVFGLDSFPEHLKAEVTDSGAQLVTVTDSVSVCPNALLTGQMGASVPESGLIVKTSQGLVIITGCAHPGIVEMIERSVELGGARPYLVMGGFHLFGASRQVIRDIIARFRSLDVVKVAPCHCTGPEAIEMFHQNFQEDYQPCGVGQVIELTP
jgi:7,8-dihydropterin-6-yl-methyl-4-(beta-D-ribofuranosyl)aminobenzene 5'-phosphate synthase